MLGLTSSLTCRHVPVCVVWPLSVVRVHGRAQPEHIKGAACGRKADIWSYAGVLLEMLTGTPPAVLLQSSSGEQHCKE